MFGATLQHASFLLTEAGSLSQTQKCTDMAGLAGQLALGVPCLWLLRVELQAGCHTPGIYMGSGGVLNSGPHDCMVSASTAEQ